MKKIKKIVILILDTIEIYLPTFCIGITFVSFIIQIASRYIFNNQIEWSFELTLMSFLWCLIFAASNASRTNTHVSFGMFYDKLRPPMQLVFRLVANLFIVVTFSILLWPAYEFVDFMSIKKSSVIKIPMNILYFPFVIFVLLTIIHSLRALIHDIKNAVELIAHKGGK